MKKGEQGIAILAPLISRLKPESTDSNEETVDDKEGRASTVKVLRGFKVVHVFDVSQTDGEPPPEFAGITGEPGDKLTLLEAVVRSHDIELLYERPLSGALGVSEGGRIRVQPELDPAEKFSVLAHELAHELLHRGERRAETTKTIRETEAEAVAFVVYRASGIDSKDRSRDYIREFRTPVELFLASITDCNDHVVRSVEMASE